MTLRIVVLFINHVIRREFVKALRFPYLRSEIFSDERGVQIGHREPGQECFGFFDIVHRKGEDTDEEITGIDRGTEDICREEPCVGGMLFKEEWSGQSGIL